MVVILKGEEILIQVKLMTQKTKILEIKRNNYLLKFNITLIGCRLCEIMTMSYKEMTICLNSQMKRNMLMKLINERMMKRMMKKSMNIMMRKVMIMKVQMEVARDNTINNKSYLENKSYQASLMTIMNMRMIHLQIYKPHRVRRIIIEIRTIVTTQV